MPTFRRCENNVTIDGEIFLLSDVISVVSDYKNSGLIHYYDEKKHYDSDGKTQRVSETPSCIMNKILSNIVGIRMAKAQREIDERHLEHLRNKGR